MDFAFNCINTLTLLTNEKTYPCLVVFFFFPLLCHCATKFLKGTITGYLDKQNLHNAVISLLSIKDSSSCKICKGPIPRVILK